MAKVQGRQVVRNLQAPPLPSVTVRPIDSFYVPQKRPVSPLIKELASSLSSMVPALSQYTEAQESKVEVEEGAKATKLWKENRLGFKKAVKKGLIPEGANPYFVKQYVQLELNQKASDFTDGLFYEYANKKLFNNTDPNAFEGFYKDYFENWRKENKLDFYDDVDLAEAFFPILESGKNNLYSQHIQARIGVITTQGKLEFSKNLHTKLNTAFSSNAEVLANSIKELGIDTSLPVSEWSENWRHTFAVTEMQKIIDESIESGMNIDDINTMVRTVVSTYAVQQGDKAILNVLVDLQQGTGSYASTLEGEKIIKETRDKITRDENFDITTYNLRKQLQEGQRIDAVDDAFVNFVDQAGGIENLSNAQINDFVVGDFEQADGTKFNANADERERIYLLKEKFINGALSTYNDKEFIKLIYERIKEDPYDTSIMDDLINAMGPDGDITIEMYRTLKTDLIISRKFHRHAYVQSLQYQKLEKLIEDGITNYKQFTGPEGLSILPLAVNEAQATFYRRAVAFLGNPNNFDADGNFKYSIDEFEALMRKDVNNIVMMTLASTQNIGSDNQNQFKEDLATYKNTLFNIQVLLEE